MSSSLLESGKSADQELESKSSGDSVTGCSTHVTTWVDVKVVDDAGNAIDGVAVTITLPDGTVANGTTKDGGIFGTDGFAPGNGKCRIAIDGHQIDWLEPL